MSAAVRLGLRANARQFALLVGLNALVGALVGLERSVLPLVGKRDFGLHSTATVLAFVVAFGAAKALTNLAAGELAERVGRKRLLVIGWAVALPVPLLLGTAFAQATFRAPIRRAWSQAGLVNNLNDALAWGLAPLYLAAHGASVRQIAVVAAAYPVVWGAGQLVTGWLSDSVGRKPLIATGMLVQAGALWPLRAGHRACTPSP